MGVYSFSLKKKDLSLGKTLQRKLFAKALFINTYKKINFRYINL